MHWLLNLKIRFLLFISFSALVYYAIDLNSQNWFKADFKYELKLDSVDQFYNPLNKSFFDPIKSTNTFNYIVEERQNRNSIILGSFDVYKPNGQKIVSVIRKYAIKNKDKTHVETATTKSRSGYLFGPIGEAKSFTYWHLNYDTPLTMKYSKTTQIFGLDVIEYSANQVVDQTKDLSHLENVPNLYGMETDVNLKLYVEPIAGFLVSFKDESSVYYYDIKNKQRLHPWNSFSNIVSKESQVFNVKKVKEIIFTQRLNLISFSLIILLSTLILVFNLKPFKPRQISKYQIIFEFIKTNIFCLISFLIGAVVVFGWIINEPVLKQVLPTFVAMQFNTALGFVLVSFSVILMSFNQKRISQLLAFATIILGVVTLLEYIVNINIGLDEFFIKDNLGVKTSQPGRMAPNTALCFVLIGLLSFWYDANKKLIFLEIAILSSLVALSGVAFLGYMMDVESAYGWGNLTRMAIHTSAAFLLLAAHYIFYFSFFSKHKIPLEKILLPFSVIVSILMFIAFSENEKKDLEQKTSQAKLERIAIIENGISTTVQALSRMADRWEETDKFKVSWDADAASYVKDFNLQSIVYISNDLNVKWVIPNQNNELILIQSLILNEKRKASMSLVQKNREPSISEVIEIKKGVRGLLIFTPIFKKDIFKGLILSVLKIQPFIDDLLSYDSIDMPYYTKIYQDNALVYKQSHANESQSKKILSVGHFKYLPNNMNITVWPSPRTVYLSDGFSKYLYPFLNQIFFLLLLIIFISRKKTQVTNKKLEDAHKFLFELLGKVNIGVLSINNKGQINYANSSLCELFKYNENEILNKEIEMLVPEEIKNEHISYRNQYLNNPIPRYLKNGQDLIGKKKDGTAFTCKISLNPLWHQNELIVIATIFDMTEIIKREQEISKLNTQYKLALDGVGVGVWDWYNVNQKDLFWSDRFLELLGYKPNEINVTIDIFSNFLHPEDAERTWQATNDYWENKTSLYDVEFRLLCKNREYKWFRATGKAVFDDLGKPLRMVGSVEDIDDKKRLEIKNNRLLDVFDQSTDFICQRLLDGTVIYANEAFLQITGRENISELSFSNIHSEDQIKYANENILPKLANGAHTWHGEFNINNKYGDEVPCLFTGIAHRNLKGEIEFLTGIFRDITDLKKKEEELVRSNQELEQFAFIASHDLKAPIRHIKSFLEIFKEETESLDLNDEAREAISIISNSADKMKRLIDDILKYSSVGISEYGFEETDLNSVFHDIKSMLKTEIEQAHASIEYENLPTIYCEPGMIHELLQNLLTNSLKYKNDDVPPKIKIDFKENNSFWEFTFSDNGIGVPVEKRELIFEIFKRAHTSSKYSGTGIGLAICKKIVELHLGSIYVKQNEENGSTFIFTISKFLKHRDL